MATPRENPSGSPRSGHFVLGTALPAALAVTAATALAPTPAAASIPPDPTATAPAPASATPQSGPATTAAPTAPTRLSTAGPERSASPPRPGAGRLRDDPPPTSRACSFTAPVCVHTSITAVPPWAARAVLRAAESALSAYRALGLPMPLPDAGRGGTSEYDLYLIPPTDPAGAPVAALTVADPESDPRPTDQASAYTLFPVPSTWGCDLSFEVARHAAEALLLRADGAAERGMLAASASYLASIVAPCAAVETPAIDAFQSQPHRAITDPILGPASGALLFPMYLEENGGTGDPGHLVTSLFAIAAQKTPPSSPTWHNEPDTFDALRSSLRFRRGSLDDLLLGFAVDRAFVGDRSDGAHLWATDHHGAAGRVFFEWSVPYSTLPRRLAPARPLEPTGATYLWLDLASAPKDAEITFVADWELPAVFRWSLVKVDKTGTETGRIDVAGIFGESHAERTVILREELAGLIVAGTFTGSLDRTLPFDPDEPPFMPHSYEVTLYGPINAAPTPTLAPPP